jgi:hypothetical protein
MALTRRKPTPFETILGAFTLQDVAEPFRLTLDADTPYGEAEPQFILIEPDVVPVEQGERPLGYLTAAEISKNKKKKGKRVHNQFPSPPK